MGTELRMEGRGIELECAEFFLNVMLAPLILLSPLLVRASLDESSLKLDFCFDGPHSAKPVGKSFSYHAYYMMII